MRFAKIPYISFMIDGLLTYKSFNVCIFQTIVKFVSLQHLIFLKSQLYF